MSPASISPDSAIVQFLAGVMARRYRLPHRAIAEVLRDFVARREREIPASLR